MYLFLWPLFYVIDDHFLCPLHYLCQALDRFFTPNELLCNAFFPAPWLQLPSRPPHASSSSILRVTDPFHAHLAKTRTRLLHRPETFLIPFADIERVIRNFGDSHEIFSISSEAASRRHRNYSDSTPNTPQLLGMCSQRLGLYHHIAHKNSGVRPSYCAYDMHFADEHFRVRDITQSVAVHCPPSAEIRFRLCSPSKCACSRSPAMKCADGACTNALTAMYDAFGRSHRRHRQCAARF